MKETSDYTGSLRRGVHQALLDSKLEGLGAELLPLVDLICPLLSVNHAESVSSKCPTVHVVQAQHVVRSCGGTLLLVAVNVEVVVVWTVPNQATDRTSVSVECEENWLVCGEELGELLVGESLVVLGSILDLEQVNNVDEAGLDAQLAKHVQCSKELLISSTKSMTGHLLGASGAIEAVMAIKALEDQFAPPTVGYKVPDEECDLKICPNEGVAFDSEYAMSNSLGFGGHNASLIFKRV